MLLSVLLAICSATLINSAPTKEVAPVACETKKTCAGKRQVQQTQSTMQLVQQSKGSLEYVFLFGGTRSVVSALVSDFTLAGSEMHKVSFCGVSHNLICDGTTLQAASGPAPLRRDASLP
ncbi:hypothetical protein RR46_14079 [Papilio xuthus]|uniref:Uncharacterized protein n=1 Tax=Papilio xuthus TaxID=66420 RepID=A0A194PII1_PAPXU|nr:hypothetical protein RR46_14079 [Papilio xuthus]